MIIKKESNLGQAGVSKEVNKGSEFGENEKQNSEDSEEQDGSDFENKKTKW